MLIFNQPSDDWIHHVNYKAWLFIELKFKFVDTKTYFVTIELYTKFDILYERTSIFSALILLYLGHESL